MAVPDEREGHRVALGRSIGYGVVARIAGGRLRAAGSGRMGVWTSGDSGWTEVISPMIFRLSPGDRSGGAPVAGCLGMGEDADRFATCDVPVGAGDWVLVGLDGEIDAEFLRDVPHGPSADDVLRCVAQRTAERHGALAAIRV